MIDNKLGITDGAALYLTLGGGPVVLEKREEDNVLLCTSKSFYAILKQVAEIVQCQEEVSVRSKENEKNN